VYIGIIHISSSCRSTVATRGPPTRRTGSDPVRIDDTIYCNKKIIAFTYRVHVYNDIITRESCAYYKIEKINKTCTQLACTLRERNYTDRAVVTMVYKQIVTGPILFTNYSNVLQYLPFISSLWTNLYSYNSIQLYYVIVLYIPTYMCKRSDNIILYALLDLTSTQVRRPCSTLNKTVNSGIYFKLHIQKIYSVTSYTLQNNNYSSLLCTNCLK